MCVLLLVRVWVLVCAWVGVGTGAMDVFLCCGQGWCVYVCVWYDDITDVVVGVGVGASVYFGVDVDEVGCVWMCVGVDVGVGVCFWVFDMCGPVLPACICGCECGCAGVDAGVDVCVLFFGVNVGVSADVGGSAGVCAHGLGYVIGVGAGVCLGWCVGTDASVSVFVGTGL